MGTSSAQPKNQQRNRPKCWDWLNIHKIHPWPLCIYGFGDQFFPIFLIIQRIRAKKIHFKFWSSCVGVCWVFLRKIFFIVLEWHKLVTFKLWKFQVNYGSGQSISSRGKPGISASSKAVVACDVSGTGGILFPKYRIQFPHKGRMWLILHRFHVSHLSPAADPWGCSRRKHRFRVVP